MDLWHPVVVEVTAYCPCAICCGKKAGDPDFHRTANLTSTDAVPYNLAGDLVHFRIGDKVWVPIGYNVLDTVRKEDRVFTVDDRGGRLNSESEGKGLPRLDLRVREHWWAALFGRKRITVFTTSKEAK